MGISDDILREKQKLGPAASYVAPSAIGATEIKDGSVGIGTSDIADSAITEAKIAAAAVDATKGMSGGGGAVLALVPDATFIEFDGAAAGAKKIRVKDAAITLAKLGAIAGNGCTGGAGAALAIDAAAAGGLEVTGGNKLGVKNVAVTHAKLAVESKYRRISKSLDTMGAVAPIPVAPLDLGRTAIFTVPTGKTYRVTKAAVAYYTLPVDTDSLLSLTGSLIKSLATGGADVNMMTGGTGQNLQVAALTAKVGKTLSIVATDFVAGDTCYWVATDINAGGDTIINTPDVGGVVTVELYETTVSP